ncbi:hypothetical protein RFI02_11385 [Acinetobacter sichuanensis]|uniref:hypothetical protein n=1 Tax=Acinetobacter sichuanensis TaxID=2136183 RepID=UPI00281036D8|nr:hypothetical protein [Acinetobacter sichuanensis]MDQ9021710.1 hypothetical protein [Acinetobacter sichuanensis]
MFKIDVTIKDQFGERYTVQATIEKRSYTEEVMKNLKHITVDGEDIRPNFEMCFQSLYSGKIFKIVDL